MNKNFYIVGGLLIVVFIAGCFFGSSGFFRIDNRTNTNQEALIKNITLVINGGEVNPQTFTAEFKDGMTAFDVLKNQAEKSSITLKTKNYDIGVFIEVIEDKENGTDGKYWQYYINDDLPMVAADKKIVRAGDKVEFRFEKPPF